MGFTLVELIVVTVILSLLFAIGTMVFRNASMSSVAVAGNLASHMDLRRSADLLLGELLDGTEVLKGPLVIRDLANYTKILYLEEEALKQGSLAGKTFSLMTYTDTYEGSYSPDRKRRLFGGIRKLVFTPVSPGLIQAHLTLVSDSGKETGALIAIPLKNVGSAYE